jgi:hypothetical protein
LLDYFQAGHRLVAEFLLEGKAPESIVNPEVIEHGRSARPPC